MIKKVKKYWSKKSMWGKISDIIFYLLIIAMLFPSTRMMLGGFVNSIKAKLVNPSTIELSEQIQVQDLTWNMLDSEGIPVNLADYKGKVIFINQWATWCPPCVGEMPEIEKLYNAFKSDKDVAFFMVSNEKVDKINSFINDKNYQFPVFSSVSKGPIEFESRSIPTTLILSKSGKIVVKETGAANWGGKKIQGLIKRLKE